MNWAIYKDSFSMDYDETMPLHLAVTKNSITCTQRIVNSKYNVNTQDSEGRTPLALALLNPNGVSTVIVKILLSAGADIYVIDNFNRSALKIILHLTSSTMPKPDILKIILNKVKISCDNDVDLMAKRLHDVSCSLQDIVRMRNSQLTKCVLSKYIYSVNERKPPNDYTALHVAVEQMDLENIKVLVEFRANVNAKDSRNQVPLSLYSYSAEDMDENLEIIKFLMDKGTRLAQSFTVKPKSYDGYRSIFSLFKFGSEKMLRLLFQYDIDLLATDHRGCTPIHVLAENRNPSVIRVLKKKNFNVDILDNAKNTPLMYAMAVGNVGNAKFLIENGANINHQNAIGLTPLQSIFFNFQAQRVKKRKIYQSCVDLLLQRGADFQVVLGCNSCPRRHIYKTIFNLIAAFKIPEITRTILAHLAKLEVLNEPINDVIRDQIKSCWKKKRSFDFYKREFENIKNTKVYRSLNMLQILTDVDMKFAENFSSHSKIIAKLTSARKMKYPDSHVYRQLKRCITVTIRRLKTRVIASAVVNKAIHLPNNDHIVTQKIMNYLTYKDHKKLVKVYCKYKK